MVNRSKIISFELTPRGFSIKYLLESAVIVGIKSHHCAYLLPFRVRLGVL
ncbi:MAG: hypothetical protein IPQ19_10165 [Bacteroidetes bacterium]|nr:hypothetical protein [Bacteroidota bacterium]